jgi:exonuclease III
VLNARSLVKPDVYPALYAELNTNNIDLCFISETWLHSAIPSSLICPPGYGIARENRQNTRGGGVAILCRNDWRMENVILEVENMFECIWMKIMIKNSVFSVAAIYHPQGDYSYDAKDLIDYLIDSCEQISLRDPNMNIIIAADINKLNIHDLLSQQSLIQMVKTTTRCNNILDVYN